MKRTAQKLEMLLLANKMLACSVIDVVYDLLRLIKLRSTEISFCGTVSLETIKSISVCTKGDSLISRKGSESPHT